MTATQTVSVVVMAYNHANYLGKALAGIEAQQLNRPIEIVIHDDASTDGSEAIYRQFAATSRHTVKIIRQPQNIYSRQISMWPYIMAECTGELLAICEGDDFWTSPDKLALQCTALELLPHVDLCFHRATRVRWNDDQVTGNYADHGDQPRLIAPGEVIEGDGGFMPTAALLVRRSVIDTMPAWFFQQPPVIDYFIQVWGSMRGGALYLPLLGAAYREGDPTAWNQRVKVDMATVNKFELDFIEYLFYLRGSLPADFAASVDKIIRNHYLTLCNICFAHRRMEDVDKVARLIERFS
ncbi:glycosyltransferase family 2 protein [Duganella dendranthematis]|jgi:glycosyltransferase involved in cell wall biosynthesis|uniref:Glycosyltransferase family 2 protein n=1 Tax=Duganella dendranthematis TaxID=2728021 RepID=A0ABX6MEB1_9BURK|nr:glycosyltransferase family 2 protein [Duganella dendranthematis]QJD92448.1 glycosyltransferase family 2 protein [Duganella dendranthematis]